MENKLKMELDAMPVPTMTFEELEANVKPQKRSRPEKRAVVLMAAVLLLLLCGAGWAKTRYGMWLLYDSRAWSDLEAETKKYDIRLPKELDGVPFLQMQIYGHVPQGASQVQALVNPLYKPVCVDYGYRMREIIPDEKTESTWFDSVLGVSFGTTENERWRYYFQFDENSVWTACEVPESYHVIEYKGFTIQVGDTFFYDSVNGCTRYTRWAHWVDEENQVAFSLNETDYSDPNRVVECAKAIIDLNN